jgi:uncharacterized protein with HEPN domain
VSVDRDRRYLQYIREAIGLIERRTRGGRDAFLQDLDVQDAVLWRLQTLAEATGKLSEELKRRHPRNPVARGLRLPEHRCPRLPRREA